MRGRGELDRDGDLLRGDRLRGDRLRGDLLRGRRTGDCTSAATLPRERVSERRAWDGSGSATVFIADSDASTSKGMAREDEYSDPN